MKRAVERSKLDRKTNIELVETMWEQFSNLGIYELNVIDTTTHSIKDTVSAVKEKIVSGTALRFLTIPVIYVTLYTNNRFGYLKEQNSNGKIFSAFTGETGNNP